MILCTRCVLFFWWSCVTGGWIKKSMCKCSDQDLFTRWRNGLNIREYANSVASLPPTRGPQRQFRALKNPQRLILRKKASEPSAKPISVFSFTSRFPMRYHLAMEEFRKHFYHNMLCHWPCTQVSGATGGEGYSGKSLELFQCSPPCLPLTSEVK